MELLDLLKLNINVSILSGDNYGNVKWHKLTNITRHDPSEYIYNIKTKWGREVSVVASKSLLIWNKNSKVFEEKNTEDVNIGDKLPLSFNIPQTTNIITHVNLRDYLSDSEYIYGTDYNNNINKCGNKKDFDIKNDYVYLKNARRNSPYMPDKFELNRENGFFIGIYLAEGNTCKDYVGIANNDENIRNKVKEWFDKNGIVNKVQVKKFNPQRPGLSTSIRGYSTILVQFLEKFVGKYSQGKYVPNEAFMAPDEFIQGLIDGYISGDGCITDYHVVVTSVSKDLIHGISHLMSKYGIFSKLSKVICTKNNIGSKNILPRYVLSVQSKYVYKFGKIFTLSLIQKQEKLMKLIERKTLDNMAFLYEEYNDVILDKIVSIDKVMSSSNNIYNKVFDVTVPETLNFVIYNGLNIRDTSETGYIQRRLVKAMEDVKIYYDQTVRNAAGTIIQYLYGEDGIDGTKIEIQFIPYIEMNSIELQSKYYLRPEDPLQLYLTDEALSKLSSEHDWIEKAKLHYDQIVEDRDFLINTLFKGEKQNKIKYAIPFDRIIKNALKRLAVIGSSAVLTDLTPKYILDKIDDLINNLVIVRPNQGIYFLHILLRLNLSPKIIIFEQHISKPVFDWIISEIERYFIQSIANAGEMVGIVAAQSIGEIGTQATLDSFHSSGTAAAVKATSGVPRLKELLNVSKNIKTPSLTIYLKKDISVVVNPITDSDGNVTDPRIQETKLQCIKIMQQLEITRLKDILESTDIYWDPPGNTGLNTGIPDDDKFLEIYRTFAELDVRARTTNPWVLRMKFNRQKMHNFGITMMDVYIKIDLTYHQTIDCVFSDDNTDELIFRIRMTEEATKDVYPDDAIAALKAIEHNLVHNVLLKGLKNIKKVSMRLKNRKEYDPISDTFNSISEWVLDTDGTNLQEILGNPNIDQERTRSNDINEIYKTLGIEAARNALYEEFIEIFQSEDAVNYRHMSLLLDTMANKGILMSIDRHGINRGDVGPLAKASFEETTDMLINASIFGELDKINGVSANIMLGQMPPCGTGDPDIILDEDLFIKYMKDMGHDKSELNIPINYVDQTTEELQAACSTEALSLKFNAPPSTFNKKENSLPLPKVTFK